MKKSIFLLSVLSVFIPASAFAQEQCAGCIAVYGDSRSGHDTHRKIAAAITQSPASVVFNTGDLTYTSSSGDWKIFDQITADLRKKAEFFPVIGNHDTPSMTNYFKMFPQLNNARWYSVDRKGMHFIVLDTNSKYDKDPAEWSKKFNKNSVQYKWLEQDLQKSSGTPTILFSHVPFYSSGAHGGETKVVRDTLGPLVDQYGIKLVLSGHDHIYERSFSNGVYYIISGGGGAPLRDKAYNNPNSQLFLKSNNFVLISRKPGVISVEVLDSGGNKIDDFTVKLP